MRRKEREITDTNEVLAVIDKCKVCRIGVSEDNRPYVVPLNFGYVFEDGALTLFFHGAKEGKKIDILKKNNRACFEVDCDHRLLEADSACGHSFVFSSVIGFGTVEFIDDAREKVRGLNALMKHQTGKDVQFAYNEKELNGVCVYKMKVDEFTGKQKTIG